MNLISNDDIFNYIADVLYNNIQSIQEKKIAEKILIENDENYTINLIEKVMNSINNKQKKIEIEKNKWLYCILKNSYIEIKDNSKLMDKVAEIYALFNYPEEMESFVYYMPSSDEEYNPLNNSYVDNLERIRYKLKNYLLEKEKRYTKKS